jgi:hypothetical protein
MPQTPEDSSAEGGGQTLAAAVDRHSKFLENMTERLLCILNGTGIITRGDHASGNAACLTSAGVDPSTGDDDEQGEYDDCQSDDQSDDQNNDYDDIAAGLLLDLAAAAEPSTSKSSKETWTGSQLDLTMKGKKRILRDETRVRPPGRITKLLDGHWPAIRMPDVLSAMESEDFLVLFANARNPTELGDEKLAANEHKLLNFRLSHHNTPSARRLLVRMLALLNGSDRIKSPDTASQAPPEASVLASFLKLHHGVQLKRSADEMLFKSTSSDGPYAEQISTGSAKVDGVTKASSTMGGAGTGGQPEGCSEEMYAARPSRKTRQKTDEGRNFTGTSGFAG